jgi:predicted TIM-barrel fold metal-dependent hydrolase
LIIDAHVHLPCYDDTLITLEDKKIRLLDDLKSAGVDKAIVIADSELTSTIGTPLECVELFSDIENIYVIGGISPLIDYETRLSQLDEILTQKLIVACKLYPGHEFFYMDDSRLDGVVSLCEKHDVPLLVHTGWDNPQYNHPKYFVELSKKCPSLRLVMCHLYWPEIDLCYDYTADYSNIYYDISSLAHDMNCIDKTIQSLKRIADENIDRIIFGTDYGMCSIQAHIDLINALDIPEKNKEMIFSENAIKLYKLNDIFNQNG